MLSFPSLDDNGTGLRADFEWESDRFRHTISVQAGNSRWTVLEEVPLDSWRPVLQHHQLHHDSTWGAVLLLTGTSNQGHWSLSLHAPGRGILCFDVACRTKAGWAAGSEPASFGASVYSSTTSAAALLLNSRVVVCPNNAHTRVESDNCRTTIWSDQKQDSHKTATFTWQYLVKLVAANDHK
jgi:hypothetical protein